MPMPGIKTGRVFFTDKYVPGRSRSLKCDQARREYSIPVPLPPPAIFANPFSCKFNWRKATVLQGFLNFPICEYAAERADFDLCGRFVSEPPDSGNLVLNYQNSLILNDSQH